MHLEQQSLFLYILWLQENPLLIAKTKDPKMQNANHVMYMYALHTDTLHV